MKWQESVAWPEGLTISTHCVVGNPAPCPQRRPVLAKVQCTAVPVEFGSVAWHDRVKVPLEVSTRTAVRVPLGFKLRLPPSLLSLSLSPSLGEVGDEFAGDCVGGDDGRAVGRLGTCTCCATPTAVRKKQSRPAVIVTLTL